MKEMKQGIAAASADRTEGDTGNGKDQATNDARKEGQEAEERPKFKRDDRGGIKTFTF